MRSVTISGTDLKVSRFSFGTASLHHVGTTLQQCEHLKAAEDAGFSHFDTAPLYGFGEAERAIGLAFASSAHVTVATKVGLYPPGGGEQSRFAMLARKLGGQFIPTLSRPAADWSIARARESLESSFRRLRRERIDLLLLHEPCVGVLATDEWGQWLESLGDQVGSIGMAGPKNSLMPFLELKGPFSQVLQTRDSLEGQEADFITASGRQLQFTYGYLANIHKPLTAAEVLTRALNRNRFGSVVVSTRKRERLREIAALASIDTLEVPVGSR